MSRRSSRLSGLTMVIDREVSRGHVQGMVLVLGQVQDVGQPVGLIVGDVGDFHAVFPKDLWDTLISIWDMLTT